MIYFYGFHSGLSLYSVKASMAITHLMRNGDKENGVNVDLLFAIEIYKLILLHANEAFSDRN